MKLRIKGNTIRLRLSRSEVDRFREGREVLETTRFGPGDHNRLTYMITPIGSAELTASFAENRIIIGIPKAVGDQWADTEQIGVEARISVGEGEVLEVVIEKDFACKQTSDGEDQTDLFQNPDANGEC